MKQATHTRSLPHTWLIGMSAGISSSLQPDSTSFQGADSKHGSCIRHHTVFAVPSTASRVSLREAAREAADVLALD